MTFDTLYVHPTKIKCNKSCSFCISKQQINENSQYPEYLRHQTLTQQLIKTIKNNESIKKIEITGGGEPTLNMELYNIINKLKMTNKEIKLYTNGLIFHDIPKIDVITLSTSANDINNSYDNIFHALCFYRNKCDKLRIRIYINPESILPDFSYHINKHDYEIYNMVDQIIFGIDFNSKDKNYDIEYFKKFYSFNDKYPINENKIKIDNGEKKCTDYPLLYTDGKIHPNWNFALKSDEIEYGYHISKIDKAEYGTSAKILEEIQELVDSEDQGIKLMQLLELSDIIGAVEGYLETNFKGFTLEDLIKMKEATKRSFKNGERK